MCLVELSFRCDLILLNLDLYLNIHTWLVTPVSQCRSSEPLVDSEYTPVDFFLFLFLAVMGVRCCARALSSRRKQGHSVVAVVRLLLVVASLVSELGL